VEVLRHERLRDSGLDALFRESNFGAELRRREIPCDL
jgi:hypothetical protein